LHHLEPDRAAYWLSPPGLVSPQPRAHLRGLSESFSVAWTVRGSENGMNSTRHCARPWSISGSAEFHRAPGGNPVQANFAHGNQKWRASRSIGPAGLPEPVETGTENRRRGRGHFTIGRGTLPGGLPARRPEIARCGFGGPAYRFDSTKRLGAKAALLQCRNINSSVKWANQKYRT